MSFLSTQLHDLENLFNLKLTVTQRSHLMNYLSLLDEWNARMNLARIGSTADKLQFHFFESFWLAKQFLDSHQVVVDVGSGAGFPGLAMQLYDPSLCLTLIDKSFKKTVFLKEVGRNLSLGARVVHGTGEAYSNWPGVRLATVRALKPSQDLVKVLGQHGVLLLVLHGAEPGRILNRLRILRREQVPGSLRRFATLFECNGGHRERDMGDL